MAEGHKPQYAALPVRAISDARLTATHFRVLGAIAYSDRLSRHRHNGKLGQGCWASNKRLAEMTGVNYSNLSTAIRELAQWGFITSERHPLNARTRVYRVIYEGDTSPMGTLSGGDDVMPTGKLSGDIGGESAADTGDFEPGPGNALPEGKPKPPIVCPPKNIVAEDQGHKHVEYIPQKREDIPLKREINSAEAAPLRSGDGLRRMPARNIGGFLALVERELDSGGELDRVTRAHIQVIIDSYGPSDPLVYRAERILEKRNAA